eukprot:3445790-Amphidinium_carterae.1
MGMELPEMEVERASFSIDDQHLQASRQKHNQQKRTHVTTMFPEIYWCALLVYLSLPLRKKE